MPDDFGMAISLPGYDVTTAPDQFMYFNSSWPLIKIDTDLSGTMTLSGNPSVDLVTHNLGYPPLTFVWSHQNGFYPYYINSINSQTISFDGTAGDSIQYYICRNPLNINYLAQSINLTGSGEGQPVGNFGLKFSKPGYDASNGDYRNFTLHSATKSLQVHQVIYQQLGQFQDTEYGLPDFTNNGLKYLTDLPYRPVYFAFMSYDNNNFFPLFAASQTFPKVDYNSIDGGIIINAQTATGWGVFYILLDPYQSTDIASVIL